jgi:hypothetical protein
MTPGNLKVLAGLGILKLAVMGIIVDKLVGAPPSHSNKNNPTNHPANFHDSTDCDSIDQCNSMDFSASTNTNHSAPGIYRARGTHS